MQEVRKKDSICFDPNHHEEGGDAEVGASCLGEVQILEEANPW